MDQSPHSLRVQLTEAQSGLGAKTDSLAKASARNKEVTFMLAWLERQYAQLDEKYQRTTTEMREVKDALGRERTLNARKRADLAMLKTRRTKV